MQIDLTIDYLRNYPEIIPTLAKYSYDEWRPVYDQAGLSYQDVVHSYEERTNIDKLPMALVALHSGQIVGTGALKLQDLDIRPNYTPWLGGMYVIEKFRGKGIGTVLIKRLLEEASKLELRCLYLWTPYSESLYARHGWEQIENVDYCGYKISIMLRNIGS